MTDKNARRFNLTTWILISLVAGIIVDFCSSDGAITSIVSLFTGSNQNLLSIPGYWRTIYVVSDLWQGVGFAICEIVRSSSMSASASLT